MPVQSRDCQAPHCPNKAAVVMQRVYLCEPHAEEVMGHLQRMGLSLSSFKGKVLELLAPDGNGQDGPLKNAG
ncbi:MAG TPA: hypothetical protein VFS62_15260 [Chloroflexota bacterium]|nr:hypothetical protein [Chloroflexota bacterium]